MNSPEQKPDDREEAQRASEPGWEACPFCGGPLLLVHCELRCLHCHALIEGCCEGDRYRPRDDADPEG
ncbi:MAG: hypothetical protein GTO62_01605 [Planctomycetales bacterium]|nr:hypothetical protein [Planctomycetales bacterium]NIP67925.1 hypothetical protein [Planctomycetales bacterium]